MRFSTVWNVLRILAIAGLGGLLLVADTFGTVTSRRLLTDLRRGEVEVATERARARFRGAEESEYQVLEINLYGVPALVILALLPYARRKRSELAMRERAGSESAEGGVPPLVHVSRGN